MATEVLTIPEEKLGWFIDTVVVGLRHRYVIGRARGVAVENLAPHRELVTWLFEHMDNLCDSSFADWMKPHPDSCDWLHDMNEALKAKKRPWKKDIKP